MITYTDMLGLVVRKPRTLPELVDLMESKRDTLWRYLKLLMEEGLVTRARLPKTKHQRHPPYLYTFRAPNEPQGHPEPAAVPQR